MEIKEFIKNNEYIAKTTSYRDLNKVEKHICHFVNNYNSFMVADLFDTMKTKGIPTQDEYIKEYLNICLQAIEQGIRTDKGYKVPKHPIIEEIIIWRASRAYLSYIIELYTLDQIRELLPEYAIYTNKDLDIIGAVDLMLMNKETLEFEFIHIAKDGAGITKKMGYKKFYNFDRGQFEGHKELFYDCDFSIFSNYNENGYPLFKDDYLIKEIKKTSGYTSVKNDYFYRFCKLMVEKYGDYNFIDQSKANLKHFRASDYIKYHENRE